MSISTEDEEKPSLRLDDEFVNAIRNELQEKLPCAQLSQRQEETDSSPEQERSDTVPLFNYPALLSPILEEQESGQSSLVVEEDSPVLRLEPQVPSSHDTFQEDIIKALQYTPTPHKDVLIVEDLEYGEEEAVFNSETYHVDDVLVVDTETNQATLIESPKPKTQLAFVAPRKLDENFHTEESDSETYDLSSDPLTPDITPYGSDTVSSPENGILSGFFLSPCSVRSDLFDSGPPSLPFDLGQSLDEVEDILDKPNNEAAQIEHELVDVGLLIKENLLPNFRDRNDPYPEMLESLSSCDTLSAFQMEDPAEITPSETSKTDSTVEERPTTLEVKFRCTPLDLPDEETPKCEESNLIFNSESGSKLSSPEDKFEDITPLIEPLVEIKIFGSDEVESLLKLEGGTMQSEPEIHDCPSYDLDIIKETSAKFLESETSNSCSYHWQESNPLDSLDDTSLESELYEARTCFDEFLLPNQSEGGGDSKAEDLLEFDPLNVTHSLTVAQPDLGSSQIPKEDLLLTTADTREKLEFSNDFVPSVEIETFKPGDSSNEKTEFEEMAGRAKKERCLESTEGWLKELLRSQEDEMKQGQSSALDTKDWPSVDELIPDTSAKQGVKPTKQGITSTLALISPDLSVSTDSSKSHSLLSSFSSTPTCDEEGKLGCLSLTLGQTPPGAPLPSPEDADKGVWRPTIGQLLELTEQVSGTEEMTTSFIEPDPSLYSAPDWESDTSDEHSSSSSGEFIWKEGDREDQIKASVVASSDLFSPQESLTMERIEEEDEKEDDEDGSEDEDGSGSEGSGAEFIPSTWDSTATPTKSAIKSPASLSRLDKKRVMFKKEKYQCVYEYPREASDEEDDEPEPWQTPTSPNFTYAMLEDWELGDSEVPASADNDSDSEESKNPKKHQDYDFYRLDYNIGSHFMVDEGEFFISSCSEGSRSEFFPGGVVEGEFAPLASDLTSLGELRHTKDQLRLELPSIRPDKGEASILDSGIDTSSA